jgi:hypothetical protein
MRNFDWQSLIETLVAVTIITVFSGLLLLGAGYALSRSAPPTTCECKP